MRFFSFDILTWKLRLIGLRLAWVERVCMTGVVLEAVQLSYLMQLPKLQG